MKSVLFKVSSLLLLSFPDIANNEIYITQVGTSNNFTLDITQDGDDNVVRLSVSHDNNTLILTKQEMTIQSVGFHIGVLVKLGVVT